MSPIQRHLDEIASLAGRGNVSRAGALLQQLQRAHPKSGDVWLVACDLALRTGDATRLGFAIERLAGCQDASHLLVSAARAVNDAGWHETLLRQDVLQDAASLPAGAGELVALELATARCELGEVAEAIGILEAAEQRATDPTLELLLLQSRMLLHNSVSGLTPEASGRLLARHDDAVRRGLEAAPAPQRSRGSGEPLTVGFFSPDLRTHSVAFFLLPLLEQLDARRTRPVLLSLDPRQDAMTGRLEAAARSKGGGLERLDQLDDRAIAARCRELHLDVVIDLCGITPGHRVRVLAERVAPVQVAWLGYPNSTGLASMAGRVVDAVTDPVDTPWPCPERRLRVPGCFVCYQPPEAETLPPVAARPEGRPLVLGSFNIARKVGPEAIGLWAGALRAVPGASLAIKSATLRHEPSRKRVAERMCRGLLAAGVDRAESRVTVLPPSVNVAENLAAYAQMDLAVDTTPYCGTTTTCEALVMGVPVVTYCPPHGPHTARVGASLLRAAGLGELVAETPEQFAAIITELDRDRGRLAALRTGLRERVLRSPLCDARGFAERWQDAIEDAWKSAGNR